MATFTLSTKADIDTTACSEADQISGLRAGEDIPPCHPVRVGTGFQIFKAVAGQKFDGISSPRAALSGQPVTVFGVGARFHASDTQLDPTKLYGLNATAGLFDDAATTKVFRPVSLYDLQIIAVGLTGA